MTLLTPPRRTAFAAVAIALLMTACTSREASETPSPSPSPATAATTTTTSGEPSPSATLTVSPAQRLARSPTYVLYRVSLGDTLESIADTFDAAPGRSEALTAERLREVNELAGEPDPGDVIAVPLVLPGTLAMIPDASIEEALAEAGNMVLLQPSLELREGLLGRLALRMVVLADGVPRDEGFGYLMHYRFTDRPAFKGGGVDEEARFADPAFVVAAGSLVDELRSEAPDDMYAFERDGVEYAVKVFPRMTLGAEDVAAMLEAAADR